jgi:ribosomal protein L21
VVSWAHLQGVTKCHSQLSKQAANSFASKRGAQVRVPSLTSEVGASVELDVLANAEKVGAPLVDGAKVTGHGGGPRARRENRRVQEEAP